MATVVEDNIQEIRDALINPLYYNIDMFDAVVSQQISSDCAEITFVNMGTANVVLNHSIILPPSASLAINGNRGEIDKTVYTVSFKDFAGTKHCLIIRKFYI